MAPVAVVIVLAVLQFLVFAWLVARARARYGIKAPATTGHEIFERWFRVQQNTVEMLIAFIPAVSLFAIYVNPNWAAWVGLIYIVGRILYLRAYVADPARRGLGFALTALPILVLLAGALLGALRAMLETNPAG
jgi:glutathione S-transferase